MSKLDFADLTEKQKKVVHLSSNHIVTACPGAGKTRSVAARAVALVENGKRIALTSFTNVGADEITTTIAVQYGIKLGNEHFSGTLHALMIRYVLRPFGHLSMGCSIAPIVATSTGGRAFLYDGLEFSSGDFTICADGHLKYDGHLLEEHPMSTRQYAALEEEAWAAKCLHAQDGSVNGNEAMYWSARVLEDHQVARDALANRFDEIIVDEAQDTSALHIRCLDALKNAGLRSLFLVGDYDQSIYSFTGASPQSTKQLASRHDLNSFRLDENHRSSQLICDVTSRLRDGVPDVAVGKNRDFIRAPSIALYDEDRISELPSLFKARLERQGVSVANSGILVKNNALKAAVLGGVPGLGREFSFLTDFAELSNLHQFDAPALGRAESFIWELIRGQDEPASKVDPPGVLEVRGMALEAAGSIAECEDCVGRWYDHLQTRIERLVLSATMTSELKYRWPKLPDGIGEESLDSLFPSRIAEGVQVSTVHGAKGRSLDGVLLVGGHGSSKPHSEIWAKYFRRGGRKTAIDFEDTRNLYVALTRAQRVLELALPNETGDQALDTFFEAGFVMRAAYHD